MANTTGQKFGGRQKGVTNKKGALQIRDAFQLLVENNLESLQADLLILKPVDRVKFIIELSKFCLPTLKSVDFQGEVTTVKRDPIVFVKKT